MTTQAIGRRELAQAYVGLVVVTLLAVLVAAVVPAFAASLRAWFSFDPTARPLPGGVAGIALANLRVLGVVLLAALAARQRELVPLLDALVAFELAVNVALVGLALGAYGPALLPR